jgi:hypothetical protein
VYYGARLGDDQPMEPLALKRTAPLGGSVAYDAGDPLYCLDAICLEWSGIGKGDYRETRRRSKCRTAPLPRISGTKATASWRAARP